MNNRKKIAWIVPKTFQITESRVYKEASSLTKAGYEVKIFSMLQIEGLKKKELVNKIEIERIDFPFLKMFGFPLKKGKLLLPIFTIRVLKKLKKFKPDVIYCMNLLSVHIGVIGKKWFRSKCIYDSHDLYVDQSERFNSHFIIRKCTMLYEKFLSRNVDHVIQTTEGRCNQFKSYYGINAVKIMNKPLVSSTNLKLPQSIIRFQNYNSKIIGYVGSIHKHRGLEQMVQAISDLEGVQIVLLGYARSKWAKDFLEKYKHQVIVIPPVSPEQITASIKIFTIGFSLIQNSGLSYYYSCPTKVFELIVAGIPQITSNFPEMKNLILNNSVGPVGRVVNPDNINEIREAVTGLLNNKEEYLKYKKNCQELSKNCEWFTEEKKIIKLVNSFWMDK